MMIANIILCKKKSSRLPGILCRQQATYLSFGTVDNFYNKDTSKNSQAQATSSFLLLMRLCGTYAGNSLGQVHNGFNILLLFIHVMCRKKGCSRVSSN